MDRFRELVKRAQTRPDIEALYKSLTAGPSLDQTTVERFLTDVQGIDPAGLFERYAVDGSWTQESLGTFLLSGDNAPTKKIDMGLPLPNAAGYGAATAKLLYLEFAQYVSGWRTVERGEYCGGVYTGIACWVSMCRT